jgi:enoyl-CoA hydratase/carnithine racemase
VKDHFKYCLVECRDHILTITLNRPEVLNAMHPAAHFELEEVFDQYAADPDLHVAILIGAGGRSFCVGTDLKELSRTGDHRKPPGGFCGITTRFNLFKPVIAAVNGLCLGGALQRLQASHAAKQRHPQHGRIHAGRLQRRRKDARQLGRH